MLISFPFRLSGSASVTTRDDADIDYLGEELAQLIQTQPGERELVPTYGVNDPAFATLDSGMLAAQIETFGPPISIEDVSTRFLSDTVQDVVVSFSPALEDVEAGASIAEQLLVDDSDPGAYDDESGSDTDQVAF